jgi:hypothetical protein
MSKNRGGSACHCVSGLVTSGLERLRQYREKRVVVSKPQARGDHSQEPVAAPVATERQLSIDSLLCEFEGRFYA